MRSWTVSEWCTFLAALSSALVAVFNAWRGKVVENKLDQHEVASEARKADLERKLPQ